MLIRFPWWFSGKESICQYTSLGWEDPLEKEMANHSSILALEIPWTEEPGGLQSIGLQRVGHSGGDLASTQIEIKEAEMVQLPRETEPGMHGFLDIRENIFWSKPFCDLSPAATLRLEKVSVIKIFSGSDK